MGDKQFNSRKKEVQKGAVERRLARFSRGSCGKRGVASDAPKQKKRWRCPWCGVTQRK